MDPRVARTLSAMMTYETGCPKRIQHLLKVYTFCKLIALEEGLDPQTQLILETTAAVHDIGIRKSLGAKGRDIRSQFIIEAGTTSAIGGVIGIILGVVLANVFTALVGVVMAGAEGFSAVPSAGGIAVSFGVSVGIGILFGYLPANKAAKLNPIDALRYD